MKILIEEKYGEYTLTANVRGVHVRYKVSKNYDVEADTNASPFTNEEVRTLIKLYEATS